MYEDTSAELVGAVPGFLSELPRLSVPRLPEGLRPPQGLRAAKFTVVFLDESLRITRGDRGELRVYIKP